MNVLAIGAHPDDLEYGCGGSLHKLAQMSNQVFMMICTAGEAGGVEGNRNRRIKEQEESARILGIKDLIWNDYPDTKIPVDQNLIGFIDKYIKLLTPEYIFIHHFNDTHQDHRNLSQATITASRNERKVLYYEGPTTQFFNPSVYSDIGDQVETKIAALKAHKSQIDKTNIAHTSILEMAKSTAIFRGSQARVRYAEAFCPVRLFLDFTERVQ